MARTHKPKHGSDAADSSDVTGPTARIDHSFASSGDASSSANFVTKHWQKTRDLVKRHKKLSLSVMIVAIAAIGAVVYLIQRPGEPVKMRAQSCSDQTLRDARGAFNAAQVDQLSKTVGHIEKNVEYKDDPNCLYVLVTYYINISDSEKAAAHYAQLEKAYDPETGYSSVIADVARKPGQLKPTVDLLKETADDFHGSFGGTGEGPN